eukprot:Em0126g11a
MEDVVSTSDDKQTFEAQLVNRLREIMLGVDLEEVSSKQLRLKLEEEMKMDLKSVSRVSGPADARHSRTTGKALKNMRLSLLGMVTLSMLREIDNFYPEVFTYFNVRLYDLPDSELMKHWDKTYQFIKTAKVVAYKMKEYQLTLDDALAYVKSKRSCINPNDGFIQQLRAYESILSARLTLPAPKTMSEPNIRNMSPNMEMDYPLSPHHEEQSSFTHQFMSTNDLQQEGHLNSNWSPTRTNLMNSGQVNKTEGVLQFLSSLPPLSDDDEVYREHSECSKPGHSSSLSLLLPRAGDQSGGKESTLSNSTGGLCFSHNESRGTHTVPAIDVRAGKGLMLVSVAPNGGASTVDEHVESGSVIVATVPDVCNPAADPHVVIGTDKSVGTEGDLPGHVAGVGEEGGQEGALVQTKQISSVPERVKEIEERARGQLTMTDKVAQHSIFGSTNSLNEGSRSASPHPVEEGPLATFTAGSQSSKHTSVSPRLSSSSAGPLSPLQCNMPAFPGPGQPPMGPEPVEKIGDDLVNCLQGGGVKAKILQMEELAKDTVPVLRRKDSIASADKISGMAGLEKRAGPDVTPTPVVETKRPLSGGEERRKDEKEDKKDGQKDAGKEDEKKEKEIVREEEKKKEKEIVKEEEKKKGKEVMKEEEKKKESVKEEPKKDERVISEEYQKEKFTDKKEEEKRDKDGDSEVNSVLALRKLFGDPEPKKPEPQQWQQLQLFAKVSPKSQEPARSTSPCP